MSEIKTGSMSQIEKKYRMQDIENTVDYFCRLAIICSDKRSHDIINKYKLAIGTQTIDEYLQTCLKQYELLSENWNNKSLFDKFKLNIDGLYTLYETIYLLFNKDTDAKNSIKESDVVSLRNNLYNANKFTKETIQYNLDNGKKYIITSRLHKTFKNETVIGTTVYIHERDMIYRCLHFESEQAQKCYENVISRINSHRPIPTSCLSSVRA